MSGAREGMTFVDMSSISSNATVEFAKRLAGRGIHYLDAPVSAERLEPLEGRLPSWSEGRRRV